MSSILCQNGNKPWQDFIKAGDWNDALPLIGNGIEQAIERKHSSDPWTD